MTFPHSPFHIRDIEVPNRLVMAPLHEITDRGPRSASAGPEVQASGRTPQWGVRSRAARRLA
jgi:hypothetical protein